MFYYVEKDHFTIQQLEMCNSFSAHLKVYTCLFQKIIKYYKIIICLLKLQFFFPQKKNHILFGKQYTIHRQTNNQYCPLSIVYDQKPNISYTDYKSSINYPSLKRGIIQHSNHTCPLHQTIYKTGHDQPLKHQNYSKNQLSLKQFIKLQKSKQGSKDHP